MTRLSICIATFNRGRFIGETLDSMLPQIEPGVEIVILDGASSDNTQQVIESYCQRNSSIRYIRAATNSGVDQDYDLVVSQAAGDYCWLMTDDDLLAVGAVPKVLRALEGGGDLVVVNAEARTADFSSVVEARRVPLTVDRHYAASEAGRFFTDCANYLSFIGGVVIKRTVWLARDRRAYYGSLFIHVGVIFQHPPLTDVTVIAEPLIVIRLGNAMWTGRSFEIWNFKWPELVWSFGDFDAAAKRQVCEAQPWRRLNSLLYNRALGAFSSTEFRRFIAPRATRWPWLLAWAVAAVPGRLSHVLCVAYLSLRRTPQPLALYSLMLSKYTGAVSRWLARITAPDLTTGQRPRRESSSSTLQ